MTLFSPEEQALVRAYGEEDEVERLDLDLLPLKDMDALLREVVFSPVYDWPLASRLWPVDIVKLANLRYPKEPPLALNTWVRFSVDPAQDLGRDAYLHLKVLRTLYPDAEDLRAMRVTAEVGRLVHRRYKAELVVRIGGRYLRRDMWLDDDRGDYGTGQVLPWRETLEAVKRQAPSGTIPTEPGHGPEGNDTDA